MRRIFAAIKVVPNENFLRIYYSLKNACKYDRINWVKSENIHITLKFFGEIEENKIDQIIPELQKISTNHNSFNLLLQDVGIFGSSYKPRVIWFGINKSEALEKLAKDILDKMEPVGFIKDRQNFVPHLTIGRIKLVDNKARFTEIISKFESENIQKINISGFYLFESILSSTGPTYKVIKTFSLNTE